MTGSHLADAHATTGRPARPVVVSARPDDEEPEDERAVHTRDTVHSRDTVHNVPLEANRSESGVVEPG